MYLVGSKDENVKDGVLPLRAASVSGKFAKWSARERYEMLLSPSETKDVIGKGGFQTVALYSVGKHFCRDKDGPAGFNNNVAVAVGWAIGVSRTTCKFICNGFTGNIIILCSGIPF